MSSDANKEEGPCVGKTCHSEEQLVNVDLRRTKKLPRTKGEQKMKEWDYAEMAKAAKCYGGPQKYVEMIETNAFKKGEGTGILVGVVLTSITWVGSHLWGKRKERRKQEEQEAKEAKKYLIQKLNEEETEEKCEE